MSEDVKGKELLPHPDVEDVFRTVLTTLAAESDRGAVLIGAEIVNDHLTELFREKASSSASNTVLNRLIKYPGPLSSFSAKADMALVFGFLGESTHQSINVLRRIRNDAAHSQSEFSLLDHEERLYNILDLGPGMKGYISEKAVHIITENALLRAWEINEEHDDEDLGALFETKKEMIEFLSDSPKVMGALDQQLPRFQLGLAVAFICWAIVHARERK
jgi:DNA-binding MltR family transcriptional regulator